MDRAAAPEDLLEQMVTAFHILARHGLASGVAGHLTCRTPRADTFWAHRLGLGFEEVERGDLQELTFDLQHLGAVMPVNRTLYIHSRIYAARPDVCCILHGHWTNVVALSATRMGLRLCTQGSAIFHRAIAVHQEDDILVLTAGQGDRLAEGLGGLRGLILRNHGALLVDSSLPALVYAAITLEEAAAVQMKAAACGALVELTPDVAEEMASFLASERVIKTAWDYEARKVKR